MKKSLVLGALAVAILLVLALAVAGPASAGEGKKAAPTAFDAPPAEGTMATDPADGHEITVTKDTPWSKHEGKYYYFCSTDCKKAFDADPAKVLAGHSHGGK